MLQWSLWRRRPGRGPSLLLAGILTIALIALVAPDAARANYSTTPGWFWLNPLPTGFDSYTDASMVDDEAWVTTDGDMLLHSVDASRTWVPLPTTGGPHGGFDRIEFVSSSVGWGAAEDDGVYRTTDGGGTWTKVRGSYMEDMGTLFALDEDRAWLQTRNPNTLVRTDNGGASWQQSTPPVVLHDLVFTSASNGWAVGDVIAIGAGNNWQCTSKIYRSTDAGAQWEEVRSVLDELLVTVAAPDADHVVAVGAVTRWGVSAPSIETPLTVCTADGGSSWTTTSVSETPGLAVSVAFHDASFGWVSVNTEGDPDGWIASTEDGGASWDGAIEGTVADLAANRTGTAVVGVGDPSVIGGQVNVADDQRLLSWVAGGGFESRDPSSVAVDANITDLFFADGSTGWAVDSRQSHDISRTADAGVTWTPCRVAEYWDRITWNAVWATSPTTVWAVGTSGAMRKSTDGGRTWDMVDAATSDTLTDVAFYGTSRGWAVGDDSLMSTVDGGVTWNPNYPPGSHLWNAVAAPSADLACVTGWDNLAGRACISRTTDGGATWQQRLTLPEGVGMNGISFVDSVDGWAYGTDGALYHTVDAGWNWQRVSMSMYDQAYSIQRVSFRTTLEGWAVLVDEYENDPRGAASYLFHTVDGGVSWTPVDVGTYRYDDLTALALAGSRVWVGGHNGAIVANFDPDPSPPATTVTTSYDGKWTNHGVRLNFSATDAGIGLAYTRLSLDGQPWAYTDFVDVEPRPAYASDGVHSVVFQSTDKLGQAETPKTQLVKIDTRPPGGPNAVLATAPTGGYVGPNALFHWTAQDWEVGTLAPARGGVTRIDAVGNRAYLVDGTSLRAVDITNPNRPAPLGRLDVGLPMTDLVVVDGYAYIAVQELGLVVVNVADPTNMVSVGSVGVRAAVVPRLAVGDNLAFMTTQEGVAVIGGESPERLGQIGLVELANATDVAADGDLLVVAAGPEVLTYDASEPTRIGPVGAIEFKTWPQSVAVSREIACVTGLSGADVLSVSLVDRPRLLAHFTGAGPCSDVVMNGDLATLADANGAYRLDLDMPDKPLYLGHSWSMRIGGPLDVDASPQYVYLAEGEAGLSIQRSMRTEAASYLVDTSPSTMPDETPESGVLRILVTGLTDGAKYFHVRGRDQAGNWGPTTHVAFKVDATAPTVATNADSAWHRTFTLTATPADALSGVSSTQLSVDGGPYQSVTSVVLRTWKRGGGSGPRTVAWRATDNVGNVGTGTATVFIDGRAPVTTDDAPKDPADLWNPPPQPGAVTVTLTPTDAHSGVATTWYSLDGGTWTRGTVVRVPAVEGRHWIGYYSEDVVGNVEYSHWVPVVVDLPPGISAKAASRGSRR